MKEIKLTQGKVALVDDKDFERVSEFKWHAKLCGEKWYACHDFPNRNRTYLHKFLLPHSLYDVDHRDGNGLNNCRYNLRSATRSQNSQNAKKTQFKRSSTFKGVSWEPRHRRWRATIFADLPRKLIYLGEYKDESDAAKIYDYAAKLCFGSFACLNFP